LIPKIEKKKKIFLINFEHQIIKTNKAEKQTGDQSIKTLGQMECRRFEISKHRPSQTVVIQRRFA